MRVLKWLGLGFGLAALGIGGVVLAGHLSTEADIAAFQERVAAIAADTESAGAADWRGLPAPVQRYFAFTFPDGVPEAVVVHLEAEGQFRRPLTEGFNFTTAEQVIAVRTPALMFSATTPLVPGVWARAYDYFAEGEMEMKAKILSTITVVDERETPILNQISLRRWLLESALYPHALLPGGPVAWEPLDASSARAVVTADGLRATMIAHFAEDGSMSHMRAEEDGDLTTPYHGSGEHVSRGDYEMIDGVRVPMRFTISRAVGSEVYPFWDGRITAITFE